MTEQARPFRVIEGTGEVVESCPSCERMRDQVERLQADIEGLEKDLRAKRSENSRLKGERHKKLNLHPKYEAAHHVYAYWRERCRPKAKEDPSDDRLELILARLSQYDVDELKEAIDGAAADPFVKDGKVYNDIGLIMRGGEKVDNFRQRARPPEAPETRVIRADSSTSTGPIAYHLTPLDRALLTLRREFGHDAVEVVWSPDDWRAEEWWSPCPLHPSQARPLRIRESAGHASSVDFACAEGCLPMVVSENVRALEERQLRAQEAAAA